MADDADRDAERALFEAAVERFSRSRGAAELREKEGVGPAAGAEIATPITGEGRKRRRRAARSNGAPGQLPDVSACIDLHGLSPEEALVRVDRFLARQRRASVVLVVHGRGTRRLMGAVRTWLERDGRVRRHEVAPRRLGGGGARLVWLR